MTAQTVDTAMSTSLSNLYPSTTECEQCDIGQGQDVYAKVASLQKLTITLTLSFYFPIILFGMVGNGIAFGLMLKKSKQSSTYMYLVALSVVDNIFLLCSIGSWILFGFTNGSIDLRREVDCNLISALIYLPKQISAWLVVAVSVERTLVVYFPLKAKDICSLKRARIVIGIITAGVAVVNWHVFGSYRTIGEADDFSTDVCPGRTAYLDHYADNIHGWLDSSFYSYLPSLALVILNGAIIGKFMLAASGKVGPNEDAKSRTMAKNSKRMTIMALTLSTTYLILTTPYSIHNLVFRTRFHRAYTDPVGFFTDFLVSQILSVLYHLNHAVNLALYSLTNAHFRNKLMNLFRCQRNRRVETSSVTNTDGTQTTAVAASTM